MQVLPRRRCNCFRQFSSHRLSAVRPARKAPSGSNVSKLGLQMVTQGFWEPGDRVLVSSPPGLCVQGSVVYCKKLPSDNYVIGIRLDVPVEQWIETLGLAGHLA